MRLGKALSRPAIAIFAAGQLALAGPGGFLSFTNGSPFEWQLVSQHSYQMDWSPPSIVPSGSNVEQYLEWWYDWGPNGDCGAEATYTLVGSPIPASFTVQARQKNGKRIQIQLRDELSCIGHPRDSVIELDFIKNGGVAWILAGSGVAYTCSNPPSAWQQATYPTIGSRTMREIVMPSSHDSGMSEITRSYGGIRHNTATQPFHIYQQLVFGARYFDIRPVIRYGEWYTNHLSDAFGNAQVQVGGFGRTIKNIVADINQFNSEHPGELMIFDLSHEMNCAPNSWIKSLTDTQWQELYNLLGGINDLWSSTNTHLSEDLTTIPISEFIKPDSRAAVLIRIPDYAPLPNFTISNRDISPELIIPTTHASLQAFVQEHRLPRDGSYSATDSATYLITDQLSKLTDSRSTAQSVPLRTTWTITQHWQHILDVGNPAHSLIADSELAHRFLFSKLWNSLTMQVYPNLIEVDNINNGQFAALSMAINAYFVHGIGSLYQGSRQLVKRRRDYPGNAETVVPTDSQTHGYVLPSNITKMPRKRKLTFVDSE